MESNSKQAGPQTSKAGGPPIEKTKLQPRKSSVSTVSSHNLAVSQLERKKVEKPAMARRKSRQEGSRAGSRAHSPAGAAESQHSDDTFQDGNTAEMLGRSLVRAQKKRAEEQQERPPQGRIEPTYRLEPDESTRFSSIRVAPLVTDVVDKYLQDVQEYNPKRARYLTVGLAELVKQRLKDEKFDRYKIVVIVHLAELKPGASTVEIASQFVADPKTDNYVFLDFKDSKKGIYAGVLVFGIYHE